MSEGEGTNKDWGSGGNRWHGQIVDDSVWRDNILAGKYEDKDSVPGWVRRYKVRVFEVAIRRKEKPPPSSKS